MSGMFYSLEEAAEKLNKSKDEVKQLVKDGQIREFRDGPNILFKAEEVEALISAEEVSGPSEIEEPVVTPDETEIIELVPEETEPEIGTEEMEIPEFATEEPEVQAEEEIEIPELSTEEPELDVIEEDMQIPELAPEETAQEETADDSLMLAPEPEPVEKSEDDFIDFNADTAISEIPEDTSAPQEVSAGDSLDNILLAPETGAPADNSDINDLTDGDTALVGQGTSILGLGDNKEYDLTDDTMADTVILDGTKGGSAGLEDIEEDVSLDSFGSGSGLLDLSLQADDTSLGGILDEIYTDESNEPGLAEPQEPGLEAGMAAQPEVSAGMGDEALTPELDAAAPAMAIGVGAPQAAPDSQSNILGMLLFVPVIAVLYAVIVTFSGIRGIIPSVLGMVQNFIWYIMGLLGVVSAIIAVAAFMLTGEKKSPVTKEKKVKVKKEKAPKVKKEKVPKPKKEKKPKPPKVKKPKKK